MPDQLIVPGTNLSQTVAITAIDRAERVGVPPDVAAGMAGTPSDPMETAGDAVKKWAAGEPYRQAAVVEDHPIWTAADLARQSENTRKYRPLDPVGLGEAVGSGWSLNELARLANRMDNLTPEESVRFEELRKEYNIRRERIDLHPFTSTVLQSVGGLAETGITRALPAAIAGGAAGAVGGAIATAPIGGVGAVPVGAAGASAAAKAAFAVDSYQVNAGLTRLAIDEMRDAEGNKIDATKADIISSTAGLVMAGLDTYGAGRVASAALPRAMTRLAPKMIGDAPLMGRLATTALGRVGEGAAAEGATESAQEVISIIAEWSAQKLSEGDFTPDQRAYLVSMANVKRVLEAGAAGAVGAGVISTPNLILSTALGRAQDQETATGDANQTLAVNSHVATTKMATQSPALAARSAEEMGLAQMVYLDPDAALKLSVGDLKALGLTPESVASYARDGQAIEISGGRIVSAPRELAERVIPYTMVNPLGAFPALARTNVSATTREQIDAPGSPLSSKAQYDERADAAGELAYALQAQADRELQAKLTYDSALAAKKEEIKAAVGRNASLQHEIVARHGMSPAEYVDSVVSVWSNMAQSMADEDMTAAQWLDALSIDPNVAVTSKPDRKGLYDNGKITLDRIADTSTLFHEGAHHFLTMSLLAYRNGSLSEARVSELESLASWAGVDLKEAASASPSSGGGRSAYAIMQEAVARGVEETLYKGDVTPNVTAGMTDSAAAKVRTMIGRVVNMFRKVYSDFLAQIGPDRKELTPEVADVLNRWVWAAGKADQDAASASLLTAQQSAAIDQLPVDEKRREIMKSALATALAKREAAYLRDLGREEARKRAELTAEATRLAKATVGRNAIDSAQDVKLDAVEVESLYGADTLKEFKARGMIAESGDPTISVMEWMSKTKQSMNAEVSFVPPPESVDEIAMEVLNTPATLKAQIAPMVQSSLLEWRRQPTPEMLLAQKEYYDYLNDVVNILASDANKEPTGAEVAAQARDQLASMPLGQAMASKKAFGDFARGMKAQVRAIAKGDLKRAIDLARKTRLNYQLALQGYSLAKRYDATKKRASQLARVEQGRLTPEFHGAYLQVARAVGLIKSVPAWAEKIDPRAVLMREVPELAKNWESLITIKPGQDIRQVPSGNFIQVSEALTTLDRLASIEATVLKLAIGDRKQSIKEVVAAVLPTAQATKEANSGWIAKALNKADVVVQRMDFWTFALDGFKADGWANKYILQPMRAASNKYMSMMADDIDLMATSIQGLAKVATSIPNATLEALPETKYKAEFKWTSERVLAFGLLWGNQTQRDRLMDGYALTEAQSQQILDSIPEEGWTYIDEVIQLMGRNRDELFATQRAKNGYIPVAEEPLPFMAGGKMRKGGYAPIYYDYTLQPKPQDVSEVELAADRQSALIPPDSRTGRTAARKAGGGRPPMLSMGIIGEMINDKNHFISYAIPIQNFNTLMKANDNALAKEAVRILGPESYAAMVQRVDSLANPDKYHAKGMWNKAMVAVRGAAGTAILWGNVKSALASAVSSFPVYSSQVGASRLIGGMAKVALSKEARAFAEAHSPTLRERHRQLAFKAERFVTSLSVYSTIKTAKKNIITFGMIPWMVLDYIPAYAVWTSTFESSEGTIEERALKADQVVSETMPTGTDLDKGALQYDQNQMLHVLSAFSVFSTATHNRFRKQYGAWQAGEMSNADFAKFIALERLASPILWTVTLPAVGLMIGGRDDEWKKRLEMKALITETAAYQVSGIPVVRELTSYIGGQITGQPRDISVASAKVVESWLRAATNIGYAVDEGDMSKASWNTAVILSAATGLPTSVFVDRMRKAIKEAESGGDIFANLTIGNP